MKIQSYTADQVTEIANLFHQAVHAVHPSIYTTAQKEAWAPTPPNYIFWSVRLNEKKPLIAMINNTVVGFIELGENGHIDCCYTHPDFQGKGVASALYKRLLEKAIARNFAYLYVEASHTAKSFFLKHGFSVIKNNEIHRNGCLLINFTMEKCINKPQ